MSYLERPLLNVEGLDVSFKKNGESVRVVRNVDLTVQPGETVAVVGESGSGKTLTTLAVLGLVNLVGGHREATKIEFDGQDLLNASPGELRRIRGSGIGTIFQQPMMSLDPAYTVGSQVVGAIRAHEKISRKKAWAQALDLLELVQVPNPAVRAHDYPHQFSGGMCQRVMIAIAVACRPKLIIADEPTTALDVRTQASFLNLLRTVQEELDTSILYVSHDLAVVSELADRLVVMYSGEVVEVGPTAQIMKQPNHPYTSDLIGCATMPTKGQRFQSIPGQIPPAGHVAQGCQFFDRCRHSSEACCSAPVGLGRVTESWESRCRRANDLTLEGVGS